MKGFKKSVWLCFVCLCFFFSVNAQHPGFSKFYRYEASDVVRAETITDVVYDSIGNHLFFSLTGYSDYGLLTAQFKTDMQGNVLKTVVDSVDFGIFFWKNILQSEDGNYLYWGGTTANYFDTASTKWILRKTDKDLNVIWDKEYPSYTMEAANFSMIALDSGNLLLDCFKYTWANQLGMQEQPNRVYLRKVDSMGNEQAVYRPNMMDNTNSYKIVNSNEQDGALFNGPTSYGNGNRGYVTKMNPDGSEAWTKLYNTDVADSWYLSMDKDKGAQEFYYNCGQLRIHTGEEFGPPYINKIDAQGNIVWENKLSIREGNTECFFDIKALPNSNLVVAGQSYFPDESLGRGLLASYDKDGNRRWAKIYKKPGAQEESYFNKVIALPDGGFVAVGLSFVQDAAGWSTDGWLLRVDSNGCYNAECNGLVSVKDVKAKGSELKTYPNPSAGIINLERGTLFPKGTTVTLLDYLGRVIRTLPSPAGQTKIQYDLKGVSPNIYFLKIEIAGEIVQQKITIGS